MQSRVDGIWKEYHVIKQEFNLNVVFSLKNNYLQFFYWINCPTI
ncbi:hypothetical protein DYY67_0944 [Candidatus Nitrosotalea sp. TS]|nr:hypothetical protein [Candidatus Nitrosotalea sp. TS]